MSDPEAGFRLPGDADEIVVERHVLDCVLRSWEEIDLMQGLGVERYFTHDAVFAIGKTEHLGRAAIVAEFESRRRRGPRCARHHLTNVRVLLSDAGGARVHAYMLLYAGDGRAPLPLAPPALTGEVVDTLTHTPDEGWRIAERRVSPTFLSHENPSPFLAGDEVG